MKSQATSHEFDGFETICLDEHVSKPFIALAENGYRKITLINTIEILTVIC